MNRVLAAGALAIFVAAIAAIALTSTGSNDSGTPSTTAAATTTAVRRPRPPAPKPAPARVKLVAVGPYDPPPGDGTENDAEVRNAVDGKPATFWSTERYSSGLGSYKQGVGIVLDAGRRRSLTRVLVATDTPGARAEIELGDAPTGPFRVVSANRALEATTTFPLAKRAAGRYVLVWFTALPPGAREAHIGEVRALAR